MSSVAEPQFAVVPFHQIDPTIWEEFVDACDEAWLLHRYDLLQAISTWESRQNNCSFAIKDLCSPGHILAVIPGYVLQSKIVGLFNWSVIESRGGPVMRNGLGNHVREAVLAMAMDHLQSIARKGTAFEIRLSLENLAPAYRGEKTPRLNPLFNLGCEDISGQTWMLDLRKGKDAIWDNMEKRARNAIRKAEKIGVTVRLAGQPDDLEIYYDLHCKTYHRTGVQPHPKAYFEAIWRDFLPSSHAVVFFAEVDNEIVAAENFGVYKNATVYWSGAASDTGLASQANSLIQWSAIQWMIDHEIDWYDTGEAFPNIKVGKKKGLNDFKKSFGGSLFPIYRGRLLLRKRAFYFYQLLKTFKH
jgi:hypothetical protein